MSKSLTIVLPVHNAESRLRRDVTELLEIASELTPKLGVLIVDDGSTDATLEVAQELAAHYPQVAIKRHRQRRGLGATIDYVQRYVRSDAVILHDGVTPVDPQQMRSAWQSWIAQTTTATAASSASTLFDLDMHDLANLPAIHAQMERAHRRVLGFQLITPGISNETLEEVASSSTTPIPRTDTAHLADRADVGQIPPLPRPKFVSALAAFALGE